MNENAILAIAAFGVASSFVMLLVLLFGKRTSQIDARLGDTPRSRHSQARAFVAKQSLLPRMGATILPEDEGKRNRLTARLRQAGLYQRHSTGVYLGLKIVLLVVPLVAGMLLSLIGMLDIVYGLLFGLLVALLGTLLPSLWLAYLKSKRQTQVRRAMPDVLDVIVVCLEGGLSLPAAFSRVANELQTAHPLLAAEMAIVRKEIQLGRTTGEALRQFADRFDVEELRSLASVVIQSERFGASVVKALRVHADSFRIKRHQYAEAQAQKAPLKLVFPTVLFIFPALYIVLMGPAGITLYDMLDSFGSSSVNEVQSK
jgi:tight adherence protein C